MKKITCMIMVALTLVLSGCSSKYERDSNPGKLKDITVSQLEEKLAKKETFPIVFTQSFCSFCINFKDMLAGYLPDHNVTLYDVVLDEAPKDEQQKNLDTIRKTFKGFNATPSLYYVKDGKLENTFDMGNDGITKDKFDKWVQTYKLDEKKDKK